MKSNWMHTKSLWWIVESDWISKALKVTEPEFLYIVIFLIWIIVERGWISHSGSLILQWDVLCAIHSEANKHQPASITITGAWKYISTNQEMNAWKQWTHLSWLGKMGSECVTREWVEKMYSVVGDDKHDSVLFLYLQTRLEAGAQ